MCFPVQSVVIVTYNIKHFYFKAFLLIFIFILFIFFIHQTSAVPLSPVKAAAYDRVNRQNKELANYVAKLTEEKAGLHSTLSRLEQKILQYRESEARGEEVSALRRNILL